jgi:hypothetical protein
VSDQLGRLSYLFGLHYQSEDCFLHQANHRARFFGRRWLRDAAALPLVKEEGALKAIIYLSPSHSPNLRKSLGDEGRCSKAAPFSK